MNMASPQTPLLDVECARVQFGPLIAVRDVTISLQGGHLLGLIGPNGAGKTTLLRAIAGLQPLAAGRVRVLEHEVLPGAIEALRHIGFTPDTPSFYEQLTVREFLRFIGKGYDLAGAETDDRIDFWLEKVWLTEKHDVKIRSLSRGMRQRVGIARTLLASPAVVLLDEPAAGLDPGGRVQFRQLLCDLRDQGKALVVSSHILSDMSEYCSHIGIMAAGAMVQLGTVAQVSGRADESRCRYHVLLASAVTGLKATISRLDGVTDAQVDRERIVLEYGSSREDAARLLSDLIAHGLPVASFSPALAGLEEAYLRTGLAQVD